MYFVNNILLAHNFARISLKNSYPLWVRINEKQNLLNVTRKYSFLSTSAMRFIQFQRKDSEGRRTHGQSLGLLSEDGTEFADLSKHSLPGTFKQFIETPSHLETVESNLNSLQWESVNEEISLLPPVSEPEKIICIGLNYLGHCKEQNKEAPKEPMFFSKFASAITGPAGDVILPKISNV